MRCTAACCGRFCFWKEIATVASTTTGAATMDLQAAGRCPCRDLDRSVALGRPRTAEHAMCPPPCLINTVGSKAGQGRDRLEGAAGWAASGRIDRRLCCQSAKPPAPSWSASDAPSRFPTPVGDIRKDAQNSPFHLAKRYRRVQLSSATTYIILRQQGTLTYRLGSTLPHSSTQLIKVPLPFHPRNQEGGVGRWYSQ